MDKLDPNVGTGLVGAPACGDVMSASRDRSTAAADSAAELQIRVDDRGIISDVKFKTFGCGSAIASSSYMTERVKGMTLEQAGAVRNTEIAKELSLPPVKLHCSMLAEDAIKSAIRDYASKVRSAILRAAADRRQVASRSSKSGNIDVSQSVITGQTTATAQPGAAA